MRARLAEVATFYTINVPDIAAWQDHLSGAVWGKNMASGAVFPVSGAEGGSAPNMHADTIVWAAGGIWAYDLPTGAKTQVATSGYNPDVYDHWVTWEIGHTIYIKNTQTGSLHTIATTGSAALTGSVSPRLVWLVTLTAMLLWTTSI